MANNIDKKLDIDDAIDIPIKLGEVQTSKFLFYIADKTPLTATELAGDCTSDAAGVKSQLQARFENEVNIGMADTITLSGTARKGVISGGKVYIKSGKQLLSQGKLSEDEGELQAAAGFYRQAATLFQVVKNRFEAVDHASAELNDIISISKQRHDKAAKESAKDTINYHTLLATQYESEGDECSDDGTPTAVSKYEDAKEELLTARASAEDYNESRLASESSILSLDPIEEKIESTTQKAKESDIDNTAANSTNHITDENSNSSVSSQAETDNNIRNDTKSQTESQKEKETTDTTSNLSGESAELNPGTDDPDSIDSLPSKIVDSAIMDVWETISDDTEHTQYFVLKLTKTETSEGVVNDIILSFVDCEDNEIPLEVWKTHQLDIDWKQGAWYAISDVIGSAWKLESGDFEKRLNSTERTEVVELDYDFDPAEFGATTVDTNSAGSDNNRAATEPSTTESLKPDEISSTIDTDKSTNSETDDMFTESGTESTEIKTGASSKEGSESAINQGSQESPTHPEVSESASNSLTDDSEQAEDGSEEDGILGDIVSDFDDIDRE